MTCNTVKHGLSYHPFENKDNMLRVEVVSDLAYDFCSCVDISVNQTLTKSGHLMKWHRDYFLGSFRALWNVTTQNSPETCFSDTVIVYSWSLKRSIIMKTQQNMVPWCSNTRIIFSGSFKRLIIVININIWNQHVFWVWFGCRFVLNYVKGFILYRKYCSRMCLCS